MASIFVLQQIAYDRYAFPEIIGGAMGRGKLDGVIEKLMAETTRTLTLRLTEINTVDQEILHVNEIHYRPGEKPFWRTPCDNELDSDYSQPVEYEFSAGETK